MPQIDPSTYVPLNPHGYHRPDLRSLGRAHDKIIRRLDKLARTTEDKADSVRGVDLVAVRHGKDLQAVENATATMLELEGILTGAELHADEIFDSAAVLPCEEDPKNDDAVTFRKRMVEYFDKTMRPLRKKLKNVEKALLSPSEKNRSLDGLEFDPRGDM